jgi:hypothetical protein
MVSLQLSDGGVVTILHGQMGFNRVHALFQRWLLRTVETRRIGAMTAGVPTLRPVHRDVDARVMARAVAGSENIARFAEEQGNAMPKTIQLRKISVVILFQ